jgi:hypothetical protein
MPNGREMVELLEMKNYRISDECILHSVFVVFLHK